MGRRGGKYRIGKNRSSRRPDGGHNAGKKNTGQHKLLLDTRRDKLFDFELNQFLATIANQDAVGALRGNVYAKANAVGIDAAVEYVTRMNDEGYLTAPEAEDLEKLLRRFSRMR